MDARFHVQEKGEEEEEETENYDELQGLKRALLTMIEFNSLSADFIPSEDAIIRMSWKDTLQWFRRIQAFVDDIPV